MASQRLLVVWPPFSALDADGRRRVVAHELTHAALAGVTSGRTPRGWSRGSRCTSPGDRRGRRRRRATLAGEPSGRARRALRLRALSSPTPSRGWPATRQAAAYAYASAAAFYIADRYGRARCSASTTRSTTTGLRGRAAARRSTDARAAPHARRLARRSIATCRALGLA